MTIIHQQLKIHDEKSDEESFIMIESLKIFDSSENDLNLINNILNMLNKTIMKENKFNKTMQSFTATAKNIFQ